MSTPASRRADAFAGAVPARSVRGAGSPLPARSARPRQVHLILNPTAGGGRAARLLPRMERGVRRRFGAGATSWTTTAPGDATRRARAAAEDGAELILVAGGDGTIQEVVNGLFENGRPLNPRCELGILSCGTGRGFAGSIGLATSLDEQMERLETDPVRLLDVGRVRYATRDGSVAERLFVNECQGGIGGAVVRAVGMAHKRLGGTLAFGIAAVSELVHCACAALRVELDGKLAASDAFLGLVVGNGARCGGGMRLTPDAVPDDGLLDVVLIGAMTVPARLMAFPRIYRGLHTRIPQVTAFQCRRITVEGAADVPLEADGELLGGLPCEIDVLPGLLRVRGAAPGAAARGPARA